MIPTTRNLDTLRATLSPDALARADRLTAEMRAEMLLAEIRRQFDATQAEVASALGVARSSPTAVDIADELPLGTLRRLAQSLGLGIDVSVVLADGRRVGLAQGLAAPDRLTAA